MKTFLRTVFAAVALASAASPALATTVYNSTPTAGWFYGNGNNYTPANTSVFTDGTTGNEIDLRAHMRGDVAPASVGNVYSFALGTTPMSFDWGISTRTIKNVTASITLKNLGTGQMFTYDPLYVGNDNASANVGGLKTSQNSFQLNYVPGLFTPNVRSNYLVTVDVGNVGSSSIKVNVGGVPEPASWAMMLAGFGIVGAGSRRRSRSSAASAVTA